MSIFVVWGRAPRTCPTCGDPESDKFPKVRPFCCVAHRYKYTREQKKLDHARFMATRAKVGDLVENDGVVCCVKTVTSQEVAGDKDHFKRYAKWESTFTTWCGCYVEIPQPLEDAILTCVSCIGEGAEVRCLSLSSST